MVAHVIDEFRVLKDYIVMILDQEVAEDAQVCYRIDGQTYSPVSLGATTVPIPRNYIAVKAKKSFKGSSVEVV